MDSDINGLASSTLGFNFNSEQPAVPSDAKQMEIDGTSNYTLDSFGPGEFDYSELDSQSLSSTRCSSVAGESSDNHISNALIRSTRSISPYLQVSFIFVYLTNSNFISNSYSHRFRQVARSTPPLCLLHRPSPHSAVRELHVEPDRTAHIRVDRLQEPESSSATQLATEPSTHFMSELRALKRMRISSRRRTAF